MNPQILENYAQRFMVWCRAGVRSYFPISLHRLSLRATNARKPLKPACTIPCVCAQHEHVHTLLKAQEKC